MNTVRNIASGINTIYRIVATNTGRIIRVTMFVYNAQAGAREYLESLPVYWHNWRRAWPNFVESVQDITSSVRLKVSELISTATGPARYIGTKLKVALDWLREAIGILHARAVAEGEAVGRYIRYQWRTLGADPAPAAETVRIAEANFAAQNDFYRRGQAELRAERVRLRRVRIAENNAARISASEEMFGQEFKQQSITEMFEESASYLPAQGVTPEDMALEYEAAEMNKDLLNQYQEALNNNSEFTHDLSLGSFEPNELGESEATAAELMDLDPLESWEYALEPVDEELLEVGGASVVEEELLPYIHPEQGGQSGRGIGRYIRGKWRQVSSRLPNLPGTTGPAPLPTVTRRVWYEGNVPDGDGLGVGALSDEINPIASSAGGAIDEIFPRASSAADALDFDNSILDRVEAPAVAVEAEEISAAMGQILDNDLVNGLLDFYVAPAPGGVPKFSLWVNAETDVVSQIVQAVVTYLIYLAQKAIDEGNRAIAMMQVLPYNEYGFFPEKLDGFSAAYTGKTALNDPLPVALRFLFNYATGIIDYDYQHFTRSKSLDYYRDYGKFLFIFVKLQGQIKRLLPLPEAFHDEFIPSLGDVHVQLKGLKEEYDTLELDAPVQLGYDSALYRGLTYEEAEKEFTEVVTAFFKTKTEELRNSMFGSVESLIAAREAQFKPETDIELTSRLLKDYVQIIAETRRRRAELNVIAKTARNNWATARHAALQKVLRLLLKPKPPKKRYLEPISYVPVNANKGFGAPWKRSKNKFEITPKPAYPFSTTERIVQVVPTLPEFLRDLIEIQKTCGLFSPEATSFKNRNVE